MKIQYLCTESIPMNERLMVFNIQRFSTHDGEGVRTVVFLKGCPLYCAWCSNPESQSVGPEVMYDRSRCRNFGDCVASGDGAISKSGQAGIRINRGFLKEPERFSEVCVSRALTVSGREMGIDELLEEIGKDLPFYRDGGGVTLSGGEPLAQVAGVVSLLKELRKRGIGTHMETSLHVPWESIRACIPYTGVFLADLKHTDSSKLREHAGANAGLVMRNMEKLAGSGAHVKIRIPVIPGFNHTENEIFRMIDFILSLKLVREVHFLPFHTMGGAKYEMLGRQDPFSEMQAMQPGELEHYVKYSKRMGLTVKTGG